MNLTIKERNAEVRVDELDTKDWFILGDDLYQVADASTTYIDVHCVNNETDIILLGRCTLVIPVDVEIIVTKR